MIKGVLIAFGIMVALWPIPIVHFVGIPFGPFIGAYFGISAAGDSNMPNAARALTFGVLLGALVLILAAVIAVILMEFTDFNRALVWGAVGVFTFYSASMGALGAMYSLLKSAE